MPGTSFMSKIYQTFEGRHTTAIFAFFVTGNVLQWFHRLDPNYIYFMTVLMGYILAHSAKEDYFARKNNNQ